ncbi:hypothetical protein TSTA_039940 [Talaromyces stipitatus ATCC 10500]|uniref:Uncharacterized protein n=1 Tax=Talaromyces stipitatus (strain ATCC 10500 / CBS 375.48 / QM 6759 / NRRL 1006) TaxID=441959 RepID=B8M457_TALSN|nr:uncharacterized protein TSTA_039940 [Talaromyces stipitatus ATCC 10500]EED20800.1 hypothetical protein TSTA_039940 [Talaromyces stipitatus ATCC 10500]
MVDASSPRNVLNLRDFYEGGSSMSPSSVPNGYNEYEQQVISKGLEMRVKEVEQKSISKKEPTPMDPCRPTSSMEKQAGGESAVGEDSNSKNDADIAPRDKDRERLRAATFGGADVHELEWKNEQASRETKELISQIERCELINVLKAKEIRLIQCGEGIREDFTDQIKNLREKLRDSKHREQELQTQLQNSLQQLVEATAQKISQRSSSATNTQQAIYQRYPGDINTIAQQSQRISYLEQAKHHAEQKAQKSALETHQANLEAKCIRKELTELRERKQQKGEKVFALTRLPGQRGIT